MSTLLDAMQVTVIFLVDVDKCLPDQKQWPEVWAKQQAWKQAKKDHEDSLVSYLTPSENSDLALYAHALLSVLMDDCWPAVAAVTEHMCRVVLTHGCEVDGSKVAPIWLWTSDDDLVLWCVVSVYCTTVSTTDDGPGDAEQICQL